MNRLISKLLGGRPMRYIQYEFTDVVDGSPVNLYEDKFGRLWHATNKWAWFFRVEVNPDYRFLCIICKKSGMHKRTARTTSGRIIYVTCSHDCWIKIKLIEQDLKKELRILGIGV